MSPSSLMSNSSLRQLTREKIKSMNSFDTESPSLKKSPNRYFFTVTVPREIGHDFNVEMHFTNPVTGKSTILPIYYSNTGGATQQGRYSKSDSYWGSGSTTQPNTSKDDDDDVERRSSRRRGARSDDDNSMWASLISLIGIIIVIVFILTNIFKIDILVSLLHSSLTVFHRSLSDGRTPMRGEGMPGTQGGSTALQTKET